MQLIGLHMWLNDQIMYLQGVSMFSIVEHCIRHKTLSTPNYVQPIMKFSYQTGCRLFPMLITELGVPFFIYGDFNATVINRETSFTCYVNLVNLESPNHWMYIEKWFYDHKTFRKFYRDFSMWANLEEFLHSNSFCKDHIKTL